MTRIVGGRFGGARLTAPPGDRTRPTSEKVRAALANALDAAGVLHGARVLDLYAGSAALGLELLSRGAATLVAVEQDRTAVQVARRNVAALRVGSAVDVVAADVATWVRTAPAAPADLLVADPPYDLPDAELRAVLAAAAEHGHLAPEADVVLERRVLPVRAGRPAPGVGSGASLWPDGFTAVRTRRYGDTELCYGRAP
ncbi:RsmD family RNA methyltransferase [Nakamurella leprariae]|uniref:23S rRNA (Adenine(2030)-N(6))-methyltransferase RlmJ n=1 Tax=Nakamurella leprariae TaxID=2803911 RepID=A0A939C0T4_9ACTN|nr:RsmD family RNA methyltransferase [Nakamurella leprariae]MBM9469555.1 23S rRNA (adenine(2030)-N(6))-methyltransferase RlmJ [Nakamurella leprariae]